MIGPKGTNHGANDRENFMLVRVGGAQDVPVDGMRVFDLAGVKVNVVSIGGAMYAFDDSCTHAGCFACTWHA